ncbi:MAG: hypothetical protein GY765_41855, partial [bacterium]|nr:hypothetical protein [bacterium]
NNAGAFDSLVSNVDTTERLNIYQNLKSKCLFSEKSGGFMDFSGIMCLLGCFLALLYGFDTFRREDYLKFLADISKPKVLYASVLISRLILLNVFFTALAGFSVVWMMINGIQVLSVYFFWFILVLLLVATFFFAVGTVIGCMKNKSAGFILMGVSYFAFMFLIPWAVNKLVYISAADISSNYKLELDNLKQMMAFENRAFNQVGVWKSGDIAPENVKRLVKGVLENEYEKFREKEEGLKNEILGNVKYYHTLASFFPVSFYLSVNKEMGSQGLLNFIDFHTYSHRLKYRFVNFYVLKKFYSKQEQTGVETFIKGNCNLFYGKNRLPFKFIRGVFLTMLYILMLFGVGFRMFNKRFKPQPVQEPGIDFPEGQNGLFILCGNEALKAEIFSFYKQEEQAICLERINSVDFPGDICLEGFFTCVCSIMNCDEEKARENLSLMGISHLEEESRGHATVLKLVAAVLTAGAGELVVLDDYFKMESRVFEAELGSLMVSLKSAGKKILYLSCDMYYPHGSLNGKVNVENYAVFPLSLDKITLR